MYDLHKKYFNSTILSVWAVYTYIYLKMRLCLMIRLSTSFDIMRYAEASINKLNLLFTQSRVLYHCFIKSYF